MSGSRSCTQEILELSSPGVEQLDGEGTSLSSVLAALDGNFNSESLEVDNESEDSNSGDKVHNIRESFSVERFLEGSTLVIPGE